MEYRAREKDNELNKQLLKELILKYSQAERELVELNRELTEKQLRLHQNLEAAAEIQKSLLPKNLSAIDSSGGLMEIPSLRTHRRGYLQYRTLG